MAGNRHAGIGRYIAALITHLLELNQNDDWVLFFCDSQQAQEVLSPRHRARVEIIYADVRHYTLAEQLQMPRVFRRAKLDLLHVPHFNVPVLYRGALVVTIHDLLWHDYRGGSVTTLPSWQYWIKYGFYRFVTSRAVARARTILVPSMSVAKTIARFYPRALTKTVVTYEGVTSTFSPGTTADKQSRTQLLYVGSLYPHKNLALVLETLLELPEYTLTIVSARSVFEQKTRAHVARLGLGARVRFAGPVSDQELVKLMRRCFAVICPSLSEGFGLPGVEALASGALVIASDIPVFREIYQRAAIFFEPTRTDSLKKAITGVTPAARAKLRALGLKLVTRYNWSTVASITSSYYHQR